MTRVLFVCLGNICRSPTAEGVFRTLVARAGMADRISTASAGTISGHAGDPANDRTLRYAADRGYDLSSHIAREIRPEDFAEYDLILAMDRENYGELRRRCPPEHAGKVKLFLDFAPPGTPREVPDPYSGGRSDFVRVLDLAEAGAVGLLEYLRRKAA